MYSQSNHIPQPPHSAGLGVSGLRPHINANQVPSPIEAIEHDRHQWTHKAYMTLPGVHAPFSTSDFIAIDQGNASPKFVRVSTWNMPSTSKLASECAIPLAAVFHPFAQLDPAEEPVPLIEAGEGGPPRCEKCRGYINPWCQWVAGGNRWKCNLCGFETQVSAEYFSNLDANLMRLDHTTRLELNKGTVDFVVSEEYWAQNPPMKISMPYYPVEPPPSGPKKPVPMNYVFAIDVSHEAATSGFLKGACEAIRRGLFGDSDSPDTSPEPSFPPDSQIAIITFDKSVHFHLLSSEFTSMLLVSDLDEMFTPTRAGLFVNPIQSRSTLEALLKSLPERFQDNLIQETALSSAIRGCLSLLMGQGGQVVVFQSTMPTVGPGALHGQPPESDLFDTDKEKKLYQPRDITWQTIGEECVEEGVGVHMFLAPNKFMDIGSIGVVASITGGDIYYQPRFEMERDNATLHSQLQRVLRRTQGYNCAMRVRCSNGLRVSAYLGNFLQRSPTDVEFGVLDADKAISVTLEHTGALDPRSYAHLQCAVLYTSVSGQRRVRVINLALHIVELAGNVYQYADLDTTVGHMVRQAIASMDRMKTSTIRDELTEKCASILLGYRNKCATTTRASQLIIPEAFKSLPAFTLAVLKTKPMKARAVSADVRNYHAHRMLSLNLRSLMYHVYPCMVALHDLSDDTALPDPNTGKIEIPSSMRASHLFMEGHGVYLIDNEDLLIFWVGGGVSPQILNDLFGADDFMKLDPHMHQLPRLETRLSNQVRNIVAHREAQRGRSIRMLIARQNMDAAEIEFSDLLVEDQNNGAHSYMDYLTVVHRQITHALNVGNSISGTPSLRSAPW
ncbi:hypothetical protein AMATHDRAFT_75494 [Amanita thiersii Skay4041]|uniref:Uncharacterized protein n=1 Tax=Amanita thiersii Skay4041 TaxID=703135 RepID=A0A2A9NS51_9AGAR|nr:hypothetical protein AMATHDRAFT_75494 [Amanita thiersii Skay4041]